MHFLPLATELLMETLLAKAGYSTPPTVWPFIILKGGRSGKGRSCPWGLKCASSWESATPPWYIVPGPTALKGLGENKGYRYLPQAHVPCFKVEFLTAMYSVFCFTCSSFSLLIYFSPILSQDIWCTFSFFFLISLPSRAGISGARSLESGLGSNHSVSQQNAYLTSPFLDYLGRSGHSNLEYARCWASPRME